VNILFLDQNPRFVGGSERISLSLCTELQRLGHSTHLLYETEGDMVKAFESVTTSTTRAAVRPLAVRHPLQVIASLRKLSKEVDEHRIDLIFTSQLGYVSLLGAARLLFGVRSVVHVGLALTFGSPLFAWARKRIAAAVTPSEPMRKTCTALGWPSERIHVVPNGVDLQRFHPVTDRGALRADLGLASRVPLVVYVGRLVVEKGVFTLVRAAGLLKRRGLEFHLAIVGAAPGTEDREIASLASEVGLGSDEFSLRQATDRPELFFAASDAAVVPSEWPEPFGLAAIEAMACATAPIVSDAGILPEIIGQENGRCVFPQGDEAQLADRIAFVLGNEEARASIGASCLARVKERYSLVECGKAYERIMTECLRKQ
jgi:glycosyltransferase involved in cell wall biosynthesis